MAKWMYQTIVFAGSMEDAIRTLEANADLINFDAGVVTDASEKDGVVTLRITDLLTAHHVFACCISDSVAGIVSIGVCSPGDGTYTACESKRGRLEYTESGDCPCGSPELWNTQGVCREGCTGKPQPHKVRSAFADPGSDL